MPSALASMGDLPHELLYEILVQLDHTDILRLRLINKAIERLSFPFFSKRYFKSRGFMITTPSITRLVDIANHPALSRCVEHLWINPDCYTETHFVEWKGRARTQAEQLESDLENASSFFYRPNHVYHLRSRELSPAQYQAWVSCMRDHFDLFETGILGERLLQALRSLRYIKSFGIRRSSTAPVVGWKHLFNTIGKDPRIVGMLAYPQRVPTYGRATQLFVIAIKCLAASGCQLKRLHVDDVELDSIDSETLPQELLTTVLSPIQDLKLTILKTRKWKDSWVRLETDVKGPDAASFGGGLVYLLEAVPNLRALDLQMYNKALHRRKPRTIKRVDQCWEVTYSFQAFAKLNENGLCTNLTELKLERLSVTLALLMDFIAPFAQKLQRLKLHHVDLINIGDRPHPWQTFFIHMLDSYTSLDTLDIFHGFEDDKSVAFITQHQRPRLPAAEVSSLYWMHRPSQAYDEHGLPDVHLFSARSTGRNQTIAKLQELITTLQYETRRFTQTWKSGEWYAMSDEIG